MPLSYSGIYYSVCIHPIAYQLPHYIDGLHIIHSITLFIIFDIYILYVFNNKCYYNNALVILANRFKIVNKYIDCSVWWCIICRVVSWRAGSS